MALLKGGRPGRVIVVWKGSQLGVAQRYTACSLTGRAGGGGGRRRGRGRRGGLLLASLFSCAAAACCVWPPLTAARVTARSVARGRVVAFYGSARADPVAGLKEVTLH